MELLIIVVNREEHFEKILSLLVEAGVSGATVLESEGLGHLLAHRIPIFAGLRQFMGENKGANRTILALIEGKDLLDTFKKLLAEESIDFTQPGTGILVAVPISEAIKPSTQTE